MIQMIQLVFGDSNFPIITTPSGSIVDVIFPSDYNYEFDSKANITINTSTGFAAKLIPIMKFRGQLKTDANADKRKATPLIGIDNVVDCIGDNRDPVGFVNGVEYSGPYHVMSSGVKMTGATHGVSDSIIYDTIEESLSNPVVSSSSYETPTETVTETPTPVETTTVDTSPTIVTTPTTPITTMDTNNTTDTSTSTGTDTRFLWWWRIWRILMTDSFGVRDDQTRKDLNKPEKKKLEQIYRNQ